MRYFIRTIGCQMNEHDSERIAGMLESAGYERADAAEQADLVVVNTCAIREKADDRLYGTLGNMYALKESNPSLRIAVGGCLVQKDRGLIFEKAPWVDVAFGTFSVAELPSLLEQREARGVAAFEFSEQTDVFPSALPSRRESRFHAWVSVSVGCDNACTFCIVPSVRGRQVSRRLGDVLREVRELVDDGVIEITLLGQNVNTYGRDLDGRPMFAELLRSLDSVEGLRRVRFTSPHPHDFTPDVIDAMASSQVVCEQIHFPLQSGSDRILTRMRRSYRVERYLRWLEQIRSAIPRIAVSTDIIVGFPGETDADFAGTLDTVERARFDSAFTFLYSKRTGTPAGDFDDQVRPAVVAARYAELTALQKRISLEKNREEIGRTHEVIVEGPSRKNDSVLKTRTRTNKILHAPGRANPGTLLHARVTSARTHYLSGVVV